jgi:hypothetical protein
MIGSALLLVEPDLLATASLAAYDDFPHLISYGLAHPPRLRYNVPACHQSAVGQIKK